MLWDLIQNIVFVCCFVFNLILYFTRPDERKVSIILMCAFGVGVIVNWNTLFMDAGKHGLLQ